MDAAPTSGAFAASGLTARKALRISRSPAEDMGLTAPNISEDRLLDAMTRYPILVNRPIVCTPHGVKLCRPSQAVLDLLDRLPPGPFAREDGQLLIDAEGKKIA